MSSYEQNCERLRQLFDEVGSSEDENSEYPDYPEHDPFSDDGEFDGDPDYNPNEDESETASEEDDEVLVETDTIQRNEDLDNLVLVDENDENWEENTKCIPEFSFFNNDADFKINIDENSSPRDIFDQLFTKDVVQKLVNATNAYGKDLCKSNQPNTRNRRTAVFHDTSELEICKFLALCLLQGQRPSPSIRHSLSKDSLYYSPIFPYTMSGRRFEQILRCFNCHMTEDGYDVSESSGEKLRKVSPILNQLLANFNLAISPPKELSLDESLLLFRGRLHFKQYIKGKKAKYGIKFYTLTSSDGYVLSMEIYQGKVESSVTTSKTQALVMRLMRPYLNKGHHLFMDNFYNSLNLSEELLANRTHSSGTLRSNRKGIPKQVVDKKLKKGEIVWRRKGLIYVSKWKDKRDVLSISTAHHPKIIETKNKHGKKLWKPHDIAHYNEHMSGVDRSDQMISYYSSPRKTIRWYKKVLFHLLDMTVWNSYYIYRKFHSKTSFLTYRDLLIKSLINLPPDKQDGQSLIISIRGRPKKTMSPAVSFRGSPILSRPGTSSLLTAATLLSRPPVASTSEANLTSTTYQNLHIMERIPLPVGYKRKSYFLKCKRCYANKRTKQTPYRCKSCPDKPVLCPDCFGDYHTTTD